MADIRAKYTRYNTGNPSIDRNLADVQRSINLLYDVPLVTGIIVSEQVIGTSDTIINHGLNRTNARWIVLDKTANETVWRVGRDKNTITLRASASVTVDLYIF